MGSNPELLRTLAKIVSMVTEDSLKIRKAPGFSMTSGEARREHVDGVGGVYEA